jgi:hypothetical protein
MEQGLGRTTPWEKICGCVLIPTNCMEQGELERLKEHSEEAAQSFLRELVKDGRDLVPFADCEDCGGTGVRP